MRSFYTYFHTRNDTGAVFYVGKGRGSRAHSVTFRNSHWQRIVAKCGHTVHIASQWDCEKDAFDHEKFLILCFKDMGVPLCNMTNGGEGVSGHRHTAESLAKMISTRKGVPLSEAHKAKLSAATKGLPLSEDHRAAVSAARKGVALSDEWRAKISAATKGVLKGPMSEEQRAKISASRKKRLANAYL
jgi:hypothetical protein